MRISQTGLIFDNPARSTLGYVLVFANGADMGDLHHSQVWEMDLATNEVVWKYMAREGVIAREFVSPHFVDMPSFGRTNWLFRARWYGVEAPKLAALGL